MRRLSTTARLLLSALRHCRRWLNLEGRYANENFDDVQHRRTNFCVQPLSMSSWRFRKLAWVLSERPAFRPRELAIELSWIDEHIGGRPYGVDVLIPRQLAKD